MAIEQYDVIACTAIGNLLDGSAPNGVDPSGLGPYAECYEEMVRAHQTDGTEAARNVYVAYAEKNPLIAALRAGDPQPRKTSWTADELLAAEFPEPKWAVPGLLPVGLTILAGRPKLGKSWLSLQMATAVGLGSEVLEREVEQGHVLYLALEDSPRRIQDRLNKQRTTNFAQVRFEFDWRNLKDGGTDDLASLVNENVYDLVIIDTLSRALGRADQMDQADMNVAMGVLQRLAMEQEIALLLVDHHRKTAQDSADPIDDVMGATSKAGVADAAMGLYRKRGEKTATLKVSGRDIEEQELSLHWSSMYYSWQLATGADGVKRDSVQSAIVDAIIDSGGEATASKIARLLGKRPNNVTRELQELVAKGAVIQGEKRGRAVPYRLP